MLFPQVHHSLENMAQFDVDKFLQQDDWSIPQLPNTCPVSPFYDAHSHPVPMPTLIDCFAIGTTAELWDLTCVDISESTAADNGDFLVDLGPLRLECETMQDARGFIVCELVETEQNFMGQLYLARHLFRNALKESRIVSEQTIDIVFRGTERLIPLHQALLHDLQDMIANWDRDSSLVGTVFLKHVSVVDVEHGSRECILVFYCFVHVVCKDGKGSSSKTRVYALYEQPVKAR